MSNHTTKICTKCKRELPATTEYFHRTKRTKSGLIAKCKECQRQYSRTHYEENTEWYRTTRKQYREENKEKERERHSKYQKENSEIIARRKKLYYMENKQLINKRNQRWEKENKPKRSEQRKRYSKKNPSKSRIYASNYRARKKSLPDTFTEQEWLYCLEYFNYTCPVCGNQLRDLFGNIEPHADHWIPLSHKDCTGTIATNMVCLCQTCNLSKGATLPEKWLKQKYGKRKAKQIVEIIETYFQSIVIGDNNANQ